MTMRKVWTEELFPLGAALVADLLLETERTGSEACPCVYCSYWAESDKCALKGVWAILNNQPAREGAESEPDPAS